MTTLINFLGQPGCVDCDTEYFNGEGWKKISTFQEGEKVLQYNKDGSAELVTPLNYIKQPASTLTYMRSESGSINQVLSDNHRFIYITSKGNIAEKPFKEIKDILLNKGRFSAKIITHFKYCDSEFNTDLTEDKLRLMIAISADGSKTGNLWRVRLFKERKIERFRMLLNNVGVPLDERVYEDGSTNFYIPTEYGCKEFPLYFYKLTGRLRDVFCEEIFYWGGYVSTGYKYNKSYSSVIKSNADIVQFLLSQNGTRVSIYIDDRVGKPCVNSKYTYNSVCYCVRVTKTKNTSLKRNGHKKPLILEDYNTKDGFQYCFTVPSGMLVLRRNNNIFITGNSGKSTLGTTLYTELKTRDYEVEFVNEYIKPATYTGEKITRYSQYTIFGMEVKQQSRLFNKLDYVIADSPVLLTAFYNFFYWGSNSLLEPCKEFYKYAKEDGVEVVNIFIDRKFKYNPKGRFQSAEQSEEVRKALLNWLPENGFEYHYLKVPIKERIPEILSILRIPEKVEDLNAII